jgi:pantoate--beta-alanine ligase
MEIITAAVSMHQASRTYRKVGKRIGFVPTMGALHEGHLALVGAARERSDVVVMSIFVNPTQFGPAEDFAQYPRDLAKDSCLAEGCGVDVLFHPEMEDIYPHGDQTTVVVTELTRGLCGPFRPGHFRGVTTVVAKLFNIVEPDVAVFGEKDYQQWLVIRRMVQDLRMNIEVLGVPTLREPGGLAMSSRNQYLTQAERRDAEAIYGALQGVQAELSKGAREVEELLKVGKKILSQPGNIQLEYLEIVDPATLIPLKQVDHPARILTAVRLNGKRLIDNIPLIP